MSELSERMAAEHWITRNNGWHCVGCGYRDIGPHEDYTAASRRHLAEVTEAAVRETIAADIEADMNHNAVRNATLATAARIARGET